MNNKNQEIMDKMTKTCTCKSISKYKFKKLIAEGNDNLVSLQNLTGAGTGACKGRYCTDRILELIDQYWESR